MPNHLQSLRVLSSRPVPTLAARALFAASLLLATSPARAAEIEDGFYGRPDNASIQAGTNQNSDVPRVGKKQPLQVLGATLESQDNANTRFELRVQVPPTEDHGATIAMLAVGGRVYARDGWGSGMDSDWGQYLMFPVSVADNAKDVARYFHVPVTFREHPGYNLAVNFAPSKPQFQVGEEVKVTMNIWNSGSKAFSFQQGGREGTARDNRYTFVASLDGKQVDDIRTNISTSRFSTLRTVKPGEVFSEPIVLNNWFAFDKPGAYHLLGSYYMAFKGGAAPDTFPWQSIIWEDYATARFTVKIVPAKPAN